MRKAVAASLAVCVLVSVTAAAEEAPAVVKTAVEQLLQGMVADSIQPAPVPGLYEVVVGPHVIYVSDDGKHMLRGDIIELATRDNVTEDRRRGAGATAVSQFSEDDMIVFGPSDAKHTVTVFTDIECGYCRKLHSEMAEYNKAGIRVRYMAFPRAGVPSDVYDRMVSVWCAADRQSAMTTAKRGGEVEAKSCENPVAREYELGCVLGISGTPTIIFENGGVVPGYVPPAELARRLEDPADG